MLWGFAVGHDGTILQGRIQSPVRHRHAVEDRRRIELVFRECFPVPRRYSQKNTAFASQPSFCLFSRFGSQLRIVKIGVQLPLIEQVGKACNK